MNIETKAIHQQIDPSTAAVAPAIHLSTTFEREADGSYPHGFIYSRTDNPNRVALEQALCRLEGGVEGAAFASGSVAMMSILQALSTGDHVIAPDDIYYGIRVILTEIFTGWGLQTAFVDMTDLVQVQAAMRPNTKLVIIETPSNPLLKITDIQAVAEIAHAGGAVLACDNTFATPIFQHPLAQGADLVVHSTTKYMGGHSDVTGGAVIARETSPFFQKIRQIQTVGGAIPSPFDCWLIQRGIPTLPYRMRVHYENAQKVAEFLADHPKVETVLYPGLASHAGHAIARRQMSGYSGMMSFLVKGGEAEAMAVAANVKVFTRATSLGGVHSLVEHRASVEAAGTKTPRNLLRLSVGLENAADLIEDLGQALKRLD